MDLIKKLTGKNPDEYEKVAKNLVDSSNVELFAKLVKQDEFLFDFIKNNVAERIRKACTKDNYLNLFNFFECYSSSYDTVIAEVLYNFGGLELLPKIKEIYISGSDEARAYAAKFLSLIPSENLTDLLPAIRIAAESEFEPLSINSIEILSNVNDMEFKNSALEKLNSSDEFEQYNAVKYLVTFRATDTLSKIIEVMKKSSLSENIAAEIPYLIPTEELIKTEDGVLVLCNIINAIPEIISPSAVLDYNIFGILEDIYLNNLTSSSAVLLKLAKQKFEQLTENEEYLFDCDKNTKEEVNAINNLLSGISNNKLKSLLYEELYEGSDFVFYAVDFADEAEELEALLDSSNQTLVYKVLTILKDKNILTSEHKNNALKVITSGDIKRAVEVL